MSQSPADATTGRTVVGFALVAIGVIMIVGVVIKMAIGFYLHDLPWLLGITAGGFAICWLGEKLTD